MKLSLFLCFAAAGCGGNVFEAAAVDHPDFVDASSDTFIGDDSADSAADTQSDSRLDTSDADSGAAMHKDSGSDGHDAGQESGQDGAQEAEPQDSGTADTWTFDSGLLDTWTAPEATAEACVVAPAFQCGDAGVVDPVNTFCLSYQGAGGSWSQTLTPTACAYCGSYNCACMAPYFEAMSALNVYCHAPHTATCSDLSGQLTVICQ